MKSRALVYILLLFIIPNTVVAQKWKRRPWDGIISLGTTNFMGDLGGGKGDASHFMGIKDFDFAATRPVLQVGLRYRFMERFSARWNLAYGIIGGDDALSGHEGRRARNLHFRSMLVETNLQLEFYFIKEELAARYIYSSVRGWPNISSYLFVGVGGFFFNPQAEYNGKWYNLQPLGTEGQGIGDNPDKYSRFALNIPFGLGLKYSIDRYWSVGAELSIRYAMTDYVDDTSGDYYNADEIRVAYGDVAAALSDRNKDPYWDGDNDTQYWTNDTDPNHLSSIPPRGSPDFNDAYLFITFNVSYRFRYGLFGGMFGGRGRAKY